MWVCVCVCVFISRTRGSWYIIVYGNSFSTTYNDIIPWYYYYYYYVFDIPNARVHRNRDNIIILWCYILYTCIILCHVPATTAKRFSYNNALYYCAVCTDAVFSKRPRKRVDSKLAAAAAAAADSRALNDSYCLCASAAIIMLCENENGRTNERKKKVKSRTKQMTVIVTAL